MSFPITIVDNFFPDPDSIVDLANTLDFEYTTDGRWPGSRTKTLDKIQRKDVYDFAQYSLCKINALYWSKPRKEIEISMGELGFQKIKPFVKNKEDQFKSINKGWVHRDNVILGGLVYLTKNPQEHTGTSIYKPKKGYFNFHRDHLSYKEQHYVEQNVNENEYNKAYELSNEYYEETINVKNVYNRLLLFDGLSFHAAQTFGYGDKDRLIFNIFLDSHYPGLAPLLRER